MANRQRKAQRRQVPAEIHADPGRWLDGVFGRKVTAVVRDRHGRWGVVFDRTELLWLGTEVEIRQHDRLLWVLYRAGVRPEGWRPPGLLRFGHWTHGALRRLYNSQRERQEQ